MAVTENNYVGNGSTVLYSFTFPYLETTDIFVSLDKVNTTAYTLENATTIRFNTAPADGAAIRIYRRTSNEDLLATFFPGSAIRAQDLNENFLQGLYTAQESANGSEDANEIAEEALARANQAIDTADAATVVANAAAADAAAAVSTSNTALSTANTALSNANSAINTANAANSKADQAITAVADALLFTLVPDVAAIPSTPEDRDAIEVRDSTGLESFTPLLGVPSTFTGDPGLSARIRYSEDDSSWIWLSYFPNDPDGRYSIVELIDGGNFTNGSSIVNGSKILDGGQF